MPVIRPDLLTLRSLKQRVYWAGTSFVFCSPASSKLATTWNKGFENRFHAISDGSSIKMYAGCSKNTFVNATSATITESRYS